MNRWFVILLFSLVLFNGFNTNSVLAVQENKFFFYGIGKDNEDCIDIGNCPSFSSLQIFIPKYFIYHNVTVELSIHKIEGSWAYLDSWYVPHLKLSTSSLNESNLPEQQYKIFEFKEVGKYILDLSYALEIFISIEEYSETIVEGAYSISNVVATNYYKDLESRDVRKGRPWAFYIPKIILITLIIVVLGLISFLILKILKRVKSQSYNINNIEKKRKSQ
ncbi:MAG: hypothetical protein ACXAC7_22095 [Candidatus Hodarchaeales archaeon]